MNTKSYNYRGFYIIVLSSYTKDEIKNVFQNLFDKFIINALILVLNNENSDVLIYTYFPFEENKCQKVYPIIWNVFKDGNLIDKKIAFPNKLANMNQCKIKVAVLNRPPFVSYKTVDKKIRIFGIEAHFLHALSKTLNFTVDLHVAGNKSSAVDVILDKFINLTIGGLGLSFTYIKPFDNTKGYIHTHLQFGFPFSNQKTSFEKCLEPFTVQMWCCLILLFVLGATVIVILKFTRRKTRIFIIGPTKTPFFDMITIFLKNPITRPSTRNFARTLTIHWMFLSLIISTAYQGTLFQNLRKIDQIPIYTVRELLDEGFKFLMPRSAENVFEFIPEVANNSVFTNENTLLTLTNPNSINKAYLMNTFDFNYLNKINSFHNLKFASSKKLFRFPIGFYMKKSSYFKPEFDSNIDKYLSNGLFKYWIGDCETLFTHTPSRQPTKLTILELQGAFQICLIFYLFSLFVFFIEMISVKFLFVKKIMNWLTY